MPSYLGQNFLIDSKAKAYIRTLVTTFKERFGIVHCIEVGPGKGAITRLITPLFGQEFYAIEKDTTFKPILQELLNDLPDSHIVFDDILNVNLLTRFSLNRDKTLVYGSLPYYITSPIIGKLFLPCVSSSVGDERGGLGTPVSLPLTDKHGDENQSLYGIFIVQKEFAEKIQTNAKKKSYLRRLLNYQYTVTYHKTIPAKGFSPAPKVDSAIISITPGITQNIDYNLMLSLLDRISGFKRKTIGKIIKILQKNIEFSPLEAASPPSAGKIGGEDNQSYSIFKKRIEELSWEEMKVLVEVLNK
ncbi:MAG TPA: rRNA adenine N-6-methyltransferase family protein [Candidatus Absconditabacterales bacterium]|nr:rRNA adenine N-6-methyltransferase family protein [Candidatus Absconditabacterales bacterium]HNG96911.1 rRNA adenine N-6-methyltransferase family protein [Candidatus Absconditabacterales bacterium]